ncbi:MAG: sugar phosphate isomerase/epimerase [Planctomycetota bacterium]|nr:sugar phosphate isomerase/epimerase [Planctomycetota bacterium]
MPQTSIGAQMYTVREFAKTPADIAKSLKKLKQIGYDAVQVSGTGPIEPAELRKMLDGEGMACAATHRGFDPMRDAPAQVLEEHQIIGCKHTAIGGLPQPYRKSAETYRQFAKEASAVARKLKDGGLTWSYHNHSFELERFGGGPAALEILYGESDPQVFNGEIDTYWIVHGGGDPAAWIRRMKGRIPLVHFKDMAVHEGKPIMSPVGAGNLNWPEILKACKEAGVEWYLVEQDTCLGDPFDALKESLDNLKSWGLK